jgi:hypothetical protein
MSAGASGVGVSSRSVVIWTGTLAMLGRLFRCAASGALPCSKSRTWPIRRPHADRRVRRRISVTMISRVNTHSEAARRAFSLILPATQRDAIYRRGPMPTADSARRDWRGSRHRPNVHRWRERMSRPRRPDPTRPDARHMRHDRMMPSGCQLHRDHAMPAGFVPAAGAVLSDRKSATPISRSTCRSTGRMPRRFSS